MQILQNLKLLNKFQITKKLIIFKDKILYNIMIFDIDKKNKNFQIMNILQLKWILYNQIQKNNQNKIFNKIKLIIDIIYI